MRTPICEIGRQGSTPVHLPKFSFVRLMVGPCSYKAETEVQFLHEAPDANFSYKILVDVPYSIIIYLSPGDGIGIRVGLRSQILGVRVSSRAPICECGGIGRPSRLKICRAMRTGSIPVTRTKVV